MTEAYRQHHGRILCDAHWLDGTLTVAPDGRIAAIESAPSPTAHREAETAKAH